MATGVAFAADFHAADVIASGGGGHCDGEEVVFASGNAADGLVVEFEAEGSGGDGLAGSQVFDADAAEFFELSGGNGPSESLPSGQVSASLQSVSGLGADYGALAFQPVVASIAEGNALVL